MCLVSCWLVPMAVAVHRCTLDLNKLWHGPGFLFSVISNIVCLLSFIIYIESFVP